MAHSNSLPLSTIIHSFYNDYAMALTIQILHVLEPHYWEHGKPLDTPNCGYDNELCVEPEKNNAGNMMTIWCHPFSE